MAADALFSFIEELQGAAPWDSVLDAGTGKYSLEWIAGLPTRRWTAVTGDAGSAETLRRTFSARMRPQDRLVSGNWTDPLLLHGEVSNVVLADYLLGAIEGFAPHFQERLFGRLRPHVGSRLYVVGLEPYPDRADNPWGEIILEVSRLMNASIVLAGHHPYREYPLDWTVRHLEGAGFAVEEARVFPISYGPRFVNECLDVCLRKLDHVTRKDLAAQLKRSAEDLRARALAIHDAHKGTRFGEDYVVYARPRREP